MGGIDVVHSTKGKTDPYHREKRHHEGSVKISQSDKMHRRIIRQGLLRYVIPTGVVYAATATLASIDAYLNTGITEQIVNPIYEASAFLVDPDKSDISYNRFVLTRGILGLSVAGLGFWGVSHQISKKHKNRINMVESVLSVPHDSPDSELEMYLKQGGKSEQTWENDRGYFFDTSADWKDIIKITEAIEDENIWVPSGDAIPSRVHDGKICVRRSLNEIVDGLNRENDCSVYLGDSKPSRQVGFLFPQQLNQGRCFFEGHIFDSLPEENKEVKGMDLTVSQLQNGKWVIGSIGHEQPKSLASSLTDKYKQETQEIKDIFHNVYYSEPSKGDLRVALMSEGTFPWKKGGVSSAIYDFINAIDGDIFEGYSGVHYEIVSTTANQNIFKRRIKFDLPKNVHLNQPIGIYGHSENPSLEERCELPQLDDDSEFKSKESYRSHEIQSTILKIEEAITSSDFDLFFEAADMVKNYFSIDELVHSKDAFEAVHDIYHTLEDVRKPDFISFYHGWRTMTENLLRVIKSDKVEADVYYSVITGLPGVYASLASREFNAPFILTEHGIYQEDMAISMANSSISAFNSDRWGTTMEFYQKLAYNQAQAITTLCECNANKQVRYGAAPEKISVIPNFIPKNGTIEDAIEYEGNGSSKFNVGLLGNIQRVKQVELFVEAAAHLRDNYPDVNWKFQIKGGKDKNDPDYFTHINRLIAQNNLGDILDIAPYNNWREAFPELDCGVLTSASEVQPRSIMELMSLGRPAVAPDVGSTKELIYGNGIDEYGPAGIIVEGASQEEIMLETANAIHELYLRKNSSAAKSEALPMEKVGPLRMTTGHYAPDNVTGNYAELIRGVLS
ncbi:MAG: DUF3492 domain-containing protein [bacterium]|nr:DUF3492 domain-containing protein [bacterium]